MILKVFYLFLTQVVYLLFRHQHVNKMFLHLPKIENNVKTSPYIREAIVIGDDRKFLSVLIGIEFDIVSNWALRKNIPHTTYRNLSENENVQELIWKEIQKANERTSSLSIRKFRMITKELDHEDGDMTATQKVKRNVLMEKFSDLIEDMYK